MQNASFIEQIIRVNFREVSYFNPYNIPEELRNLPHWVGWKRSKDGKKIPIDVKTGELAKVNDRGTWASFNKVLFVWLKGDIELDGVGFVFDAGDYVGIDLDDCRDPKTGAIERWAQDLIEELDSYT